MVAHGHVAHHPTAAASEPGQPEQRKRDSTASHAEQAAALPADDRQLRGAHRRTVPLLKRFGGRWLRD
jgi:hypothetical protein